MENFNTELLKKPIWQMTGEEFLQLNDFRVALKDSGENPNDKEYAYGIGELAKKMGCSQATIYMLKKEGVLKAAIISSIGRKIVFDVDKARELADAYQNEQRQIRREEREINM